MLLSKWIRLKELLVTTLVGWVPTIALGLVLRRLIYQLILARLGRSVYIQDGVEFSGASSIELGDGVHLFRGVRIDGRGQSTKICIGDGVALERNVDIGSFENSCLEIGEHTYISVNTCLAGPGHVKIGKQCMIAAHSGIYANNHKFADTSCWIRDQGVTQKGIVIEDDCWLGHGVTVLDGVKIGQGSVIGAGAVVTKSIPPYSVAIGVPARVIASRKSTELVNFTRNQEVAGKDNNCFYIPFSAALANVEEIIELVRPFGKLVEDTVPTHLILEKLLHTLLKFIHGAMAVDTITLLMLTEDKRHLAVCATLGLEEEVSEGIRIRFGHGFAGRIAASCKPMIVKDLSTVEVESPILRDKGVRSMVGVPVLFEGRAVGVFHVGMFHPRNFTEADAQLLQLLAKRFGLGLPPWDTFENKPTSLM